MAASPGKGPPAAQKKRTAWVLLGVSLLTTVALLFVPYGHYIAYPLLLLSTLAHELGHGIAGVLVGGHFQQFVMFADGSGYARVEGIDGRLARGVLAAGGLVGPAMASAAGFWFSHRPARARGFLLALSAMLLLALVLVVRNLFGLAFIGATATCLGVIALRATPRVSQFTVVFLSVQLALSVFTRSDYLFVKEARTAVGTSPSDVSAMADALVLPYWFWGAACGLFSLAILAVGLRSFLRNAR
ncbi:MAG: M50 family metallopeptidase [Myxococcales bacterium]|nr:M50 family metallopeptidase [Myxococcales bacterium]